MNRRTCAEDIYRMIERVRERVPGIFIRTSLMVGFPGETEEDFQMLEDFVKRGWIDHLGVFSYSHEEGAPSYRLQDDVTPEEKEERKKRLYEIQLEFSKNRLDELLGQEVEVLVEGLHPESEHLYIGRHEGQAPDIDNHVIINEGHVAPGKFHRVKITETAGLDLVGSVVS